MKKTFATLVFCVVVLAVNAQQDAQFSMYMFNKLQINPAYAGLNKTFCTNILYRQQWTGFSGAPKTGLVSLDYGYISSIHGGVGLTIDQDQIGSGSTLKAKAAYSFHKRLNVGTLGIGLDLGMIQQTLKGNFVAPDGTSSVNGGGSDPSIPWSGASVTTYDLGFGAYYQTNRLYLGLSSSHLPEQQAKATGISTIGNSWDYDYKAARHYFVLAGYTFKPNPTWEFTPSVFVKSVVATSQIDVNLMAKWNKMLFVGVSYRLKDAYIAMAGIEKKFSKQLSARFGYSYDITSSDIKKYSKGSHELMLGFCYKFVPDPTTTSHMNVRFL